MDRWSTEGLDVERNVNIRCLGWPDEEAVHEDGWLGGNKTYFDLTELDWEELRRVLQIEHEVIDRISAADEPAEAEGTIEDELYEDGALLHGLDIGIASSVVALSAAGCVPFASCNGGVFGRDHYEAHPLVAFYARADTVPLLLECAEETATGIINGDEGELVLHASSIEAMMAFATAVLARSDRFDMIRVRTTTRT